MSPPPLPPHPTPIKAGLERLGVYGSKWAATALIAVVLLWPQRERLDVGPLPLGPQSPVQAWSTSPDFSVIGHNLLSKLPPPDPRQRRAPCDPDFEVEMEGVCWVPLAVKKCPADKLIEHEGKCWSRALRVDRIPQSGDMRAGNVAGEP